MPQQMRRFLTSASGLQIIVCALGCISSLAPYVATTQRVWGWIAHSDSINPGVIIDKVEPGSPVAVAGISANDRVLAVDGKPINSIDDWEAIVNLEPGAVANVQVRRGEEELNLKLGAVQPQAAAVVLFDWQVVASLSFVLLGILLIITQRRRPTPIWRPRVVVLVALALVHLILLLSSEPIRSTLRPPLGPNSSRILLWRRWLDFVFAENVVALDVVLLGSAVAALVLLVMGLIEARSVVADPGGRRPARWNKFSVFMPVAGLPGTPLVLIALVGLDIVVIGHPMQIVGWLLRIYGGFCVLCLIAAVIAYVRAERLWGVTALGLLLNYPFALWFLLWD